MRRRLQIGTVALAATAVAFVVTTQRIGGAAAPADVSSQMTAAEHLAHMAAIGDIHAGHAMDELQRLAFQQTQPGQAAPANAALPADEAGAAARLASSSRKGEFVQMQVGATPMRAWVSYPAGSARAPVVVVIQEIFGLSDWIRGVADQLAAEGFIAVAPDLLAGRGTSGGDSRSFTNPQEMMQATMTLPAADILTKLKAAREWGLKLPQSNGKSGSVGFCFGGNQSFAFAVEEPALNAAVVYYGAPPTDGPPAQGAPFSPTARLANVKAPVLGLYGGLAQDGRIGNTVAPTDAKMKDLGKTYEPHMFDGAGHGFLRAQMDNSGANMKATQQAWPMTVAWLKKYTS